MMSFVENSRCQASCRRELQSLDFINLLIPFLTVQMFCICTACLYPYKKMLCLECAEEEHVMYFMQNFVKAMVCLISLFFFRSPQVGFFSHLSQAGFFVLVVYLFACVFKS